MCSNIAIQVKNLSKSYRIYDHPLDRLKQSIYSKLHQLIGNNSKPLFHEFWALRDISFEINKGESFGIIGQNGSGKSTLLQLICGTLNPTTGSVKVYGRIAALLELGSGFNPEFSGRENIYINGMILGLTEAEIRDHFDEILAFADIGNFIDQPTKTYSSGMLIRLAFAVQVCIEPDILIIDEAISVGDTLFQKKCFERMDQLRNKGTTLLFVSHDQEMVRMLTDKAIFLEHGISKFIGSSADTLFRYRKSLHEIETARFNQTNILNKKVQEKRAIKQNKYQTKHSETELENRIHSVVLSDSVNSSKISSFGLLNKIKNFSFGDLDVEILNVSLFNGKGEICCNFDPRDKVIIIVQCKSYINITHLNIGLRIRNKEGIKIYSWGTLNQDIAILNKSSTYRDVFWKRHFYQDEVFSVKFEFICGVGPNLYEVQTSVTEERKPYYAEQRIIHWIDEAAFFNVNTEIKSYHFGGVADLRMTSVLL